MPNCLKSLPVIRLIIVASQSIKRPLKRLPNSAPAAAAANIDSAAIVPIRAPLWILPNDPLNTT